MKRPSRATSRRSSGSRSRNSNRPLGGWPRHSRSRTCARSPTGAPRKPRSTTPKALQKPRFRWRGRDRHSATSSFIRDPAGRFGCADRWDVLGASVALPFGIAPTGFTRMMQTEGEIAGASAAAAAGISFALSTLGTTSIEDVKAANPLGRNWFQLFVWRDRDASMALVERASRAGFDTLLVTVDVAVAGARLRDIRNGMTIFRSDDHLRRPRVDQGPVAGQVRRQGHPNA